MRLAVRILPVNARCKCIAAVDAFKSAAAAAEVIQANFCQDDTHKVCGPQAVVLVKSNSAI